MASAGVPTRRPLVTIGGRGSNGTALRLTVMPMLSQPVLGLLAVELGLAQIDEREVDVGAAGEQVDAVAGIEQLLGDGLGAVERALLALLEGLRRGDLQRDRFTRDHVLQRPALLAGEDSGVDRLGVLLLAEDHAAARAADASCGSSS